MAKNDLPPPLSAEVLRTLAAEKREELAREVYDTGRVKLAMTKAAAEGFGMLRVSAPIRASLRNTRAAAKLTAFLAKAGLTFQWEHITPDPNDLGAETGADLVIAWTDDAKAALEPFTLPVINTPGNAGGLA